MVAIVKIALLDIGMTSLRKIPIGVQPSIIPDSMTSVGRNL
jgi:hypothetical protein